MERNRYIKENNTNLIKRYAIALIVSIAFIVIAIFALNSNEGQKAINVTESASTDYIVYLKDNDFYKEEFLPSNRQYIASLIKSVIADYSYTLNTDSKENVEYTYSIDAVLNISDTGNKKLLYTRTENLLPEKKLTSNDGKITIKEKISLDYAHFNNIASKFMETYDLSSSNASVLKMQLTVNSKYAEDSIVTISVPLTRHTFDIAQSNQLAANLVPGVNSSQKNPVVNKIAMVGILVFTGLAIFFTYKLIKALLDNRTDEEKYKSSVKRILVNYGEYINQTSDFQFKLDEYEIVRVNTFLDLLKIKEDLSRPILMIENKEKTNVVFAITDNAKFIYMFGLNMQQKRLAEKN